MKKMERDRARGVNAMDCWAVITLHCDVGGVPGFRSFPPWRYFQRFCDLTGDQGPVSRVNSLHESEPQI